MKLGTLSGLRGFFSAPALSDEDSTDTARLVSRYLNITLLSIPVAAAPIPFSEMPQLESFAILAAVTACLLVLRLLLRGGMVDLVSWLVVTIGIVAISAALLSRGTILSPASCGYMLVVVMAGLLLGMRGMIIAFAASALTLAFVFALETAGVLPHRVSGGTLADAVTVLYLMAVAGFNAAGALQLVTRSLRRARGEAEERRHAEENLRDQIAQRERVEQQLRQAQKMEAVGRLAGGVAHDFNNLLTIIIASSDMTLGKPDADPEVREDAERIRSAALQAAEVTRQLLAFSRKQVLAAQVLAVNDEIAKVEGMLRRLIGEDVELVVTPGAGLKSVFVDRGQLQQVVMNLAVNARDAMPNGGRLSIETANVVLDEAYAETHPDVVPGEYVQLAISDTGLGMSEEIQRVAFEPFVTTKEPGKGTGLGLATVHGIVRQSGGAINLYSEVGKGTTFRIYFPVHEGKEAPARRREAAVAERAHAGGETILLVEDEELIIGLAERILTESGYRVLTARRAEEAIEVHGSFEGNIDLLVTDVVMPGGMSGRDLARRLSEASRGIRVLYVSGYTENTIAHHGVLEEGVHFLAKPFSLEALTSKVREVLDAEQ